MNCTCHLTVNANRVKNYDPSRTTSIRRKFEAEMVRRFKKLRALIYEAVAKKDVFGLAEREQPKINQALFPKAFLFKTDAEKLILFKEWLEEEVALGILGVVNKNGKQLNNQKQWMNGYIDSAYKQGIRNSYNRMKTVGMKTPDNFEFTFASPINTRTVASIFTRTYSELKGVTDAMGQGISRTLAEGLSEGISPIKMARNLTQEVDDIGIVRARTIARTETIRAQHVASIENYQSAGVEGVYLEAEWSTAGDDLVCPICLEMAGPPNDPKIYKLDEIKNLIPAHPNCRCAALPVIK